MLKAIFTIALVGILVPAMVAQAAFSDDFESGYTAGVLGTQNGWQPQTGAGFDVSATAGLGGGWGLETPGSTVGSEKLHGVTMSNGSTIVLSADVYAGGVFAELGFRSGTGSEYLLLDIGSIFNPDGGRLVAHGDNGSNTVTGAWATAAEWYHAELSWTIGGDAVAKVWDSGNNLLTTLTNGTAGFFADPTTMAHVQIYGWSGNKFDNVNVTPEPATLAVLGLGGLLSLLRRRR